VLFRSSLIVPRSIVYCERRPKRFAVEKRGQSVDRSAGDERN
jgi:hypothetical protein